MAEPRQHHSVATLVGRAVRRRCPRGGNGGIWASWFRTHPRCPHCGLVLDRGESDYFYGAYMLNFVAAELAVMIAFVVALLVTWPAPPWNALMAGAIAFAVIAPFVLYPVSKGLWLAIDLVFRPEHSRTAG